MPNHVTNFLKVIGNKKEVAKVMKTIFIGENFSFQTFAPRPTELEDTTSPTKIASQKEYDEAVEKYNSLTEEQKVSGFHTLPITAKIQKELIKKFGVDNWYDWALKNWGTKWDAYETRDVTENSLYFDTAWATPYEALIKMSKAFPKVAIEVKYADEDFGYNCGEYALKNGRVINQNSPKGGTYNALEIAIELKGDYHITDLLNEIGAEELEADWVKEYMLYILDQETLWDGYSESVLKKLVEVGLADENYEAVARVTKLINNVEKTK